MTQLPNSDLANARDVAETATDVSPGVLLRSEAPREMCHLASNLASWPPALVLDLRDEAERDGPHPLADSGKVVHLPILDRENLFDLPSSLDELYLTMLEPPTAAKLIEAIRLIAGAPTPVLVHCTAGKDRTGVIVALALDLVGVDHAEIIADYVRTNDVIDVIFDRLGSMGMAMTPEEFRNSIPESLKGAPASAIAGVLEHVANTPGGVEGWFLDNGGNEASLEQLRRRLRPEPRSNGHV